MLFIVFYIERSKVKEVIVFYRGFIVFILVSGFMLFYKDSFDVWMDWGVNDILIVI